MTHECRTLDGVRIEVGLRVRDYDNQVGTVVKAPPPWELHDEVCWPEPRHNGHWWMVCRIDHDHASDTTHCHTKPFDGSRLTTKGVG